MMNESSEPRRWTLHGPTSRPYLEGRISVPEKIEGWLAEDEIVEVMPVSEHEATVMRLAHRVAALETAESSQLMWLRLAAQAVVDQDRSTTAGEAEFEDAVHRLWLLIHRKETN